MNSIYSVFFIKKKKTHTDQRKLQVFKSVLKEMSYKSYKAAAAKIFYPTLYTMFFISLITARHCFLGKFIATQRLFATIIFLSSWKQVFGKKSAFYLRAVFRLNNTLFVVYNKFTVINIFKVLLPTFLLHLMRREE